LLLAPAPGDPPSCGSISSAEALLLRHEKPQEDIHPEPGGCAQREDEEQDSDEQWIDVEVLGQSSTYSGDPAICPAAMKFW
jgi:hypothetical protein